MKHFLTTFTIAASILFLPFARGAVPPLWLQSQKVDNTTYFLFDSPARIERHDLVTREWLPTISLPTASGVPTAFAADDQHVYVGHERLAYRYDLDGTNQVHMINTIRNITEFQMDGDLLFLILSSKEHFISMNKSDNTVIDWENENYSTRSLNGTCIARSKNRIFGRSAESDYYINYLEYDDGGMFIDYGTQYYDDNDYNDYYYKGIAAARTFMFPDETRVIDHAGNVFAVNPLDYVTSINSMVVDVEWRGDSNSYIVLDDEKSLTAYTSSYFPTGGSSSLGHLDPRTIRISDPDVLVFSPRQRL